ncbi:MAG: sugar transferase [Vicinamibacterales bacterium]|nr:sugar transferase [Vicinamibacterales bacterium]
MAKRLCDLLAALAGLIVLAPLLGLIAVLVKMGSDGPVLYRGVRSGRYGRPFEILKFRTMVQGAESLGGGSTGKNDPRVTRLGRFLRRYKLDELPQLINVVRGEMSLVGPRPELPKYTRDYTGDEELILTVRPGITDYASMEFLRLDEVLGHEAPDLVYEMRVRPVKNALRVRYVKEQSFAGDLKIIARTLWKVIAG